MALEIRVNKEIQDYKESIFMGLSMRQLFFSALAAGMAVLIYFSFKGLLGTELVSWLCIVGALPFALLGFFRYHGMNFEQFVGAFIYSEFICSGVRTYQSENYVHDAYKEVMSDVAAREKKTQKGKKKNSEDSTAVNPDR